MSNDSKSIEGNGNVQVFGSNNNINTSVVMQQRMLTHSLIHELLDIVYSLPSPEDGSYSLRKPAKIRTKLRFNNAQRYMVIIDNHVDDYIRVDEVMKDYPNSEDIVKKLRDMFSKVADIDEEGNLCVGDGDSQLDGIESALFDTIISDSKFDADKHSTEQIEQFCIALIAYGISKCKILKDPEA